MFLHYAQDNLLDHKKAHCFESQKIPIEYFKGPCQEVIWECIWLHDTDQEVPGEFFIGPTQEIIQECIWLHDADQEVPVEFFKGPTQENIRECVWVHDEDLITKASIVELNGPRYNTGEALLFGSDGDEYLSGIIECNIVRKVKFINLLKKCKVSLIIFISFQMKWLGPEHT